MKKGFAKGLKPKPTCGAGVLSNKDFIQMQNEENMRLNKVADALLAGKIKIMPIKMPKRPDPVLKLWADGYFPGWDK